MHLLLTRHSLKFDPLDCELDPKQSPYADCYPDYAKKRSKLARLVGTESFLWCISANQKFHVYGSDKPVEWEIKVDDNRVLGFVNDNIWFRYLEGNDSLPRTVFCASKPPAEEYSVLVKFPLKQEELVCKRVFRFVNPDKAEIISEEKF